MTANKVKQWVIALLKASSSVTSTFEGGAASILSAGLDVPSDEGVYVSVESSVPGEIRGLDDVFVKLTLVSLPRNSIHGETRLYTLLNAVRAALRWYSGAPQTWTVDPSTVSLSAKFISEIQLGLPPIANGEDGSYRAEATFLVRGRDESIPA